MKNIIYILIILLFVFSGCTKNEEAVAHTNNDKNIKAYKINISMDNEKRIQETFENGNQMWRKNAKDVAHAALINEGVNVKIEDCKILSENGKEAIISASDKKGNPYKVICKKLFKPDGIWTAVEIGAEINSAQVAEGK
ncbi:MAG: hypothetical protein HZB79_03665 [Deltaproteobacteria bacterium]|nr:hypothetical protein [Deltaproteobacteria bacterium]